MGSDLRNELEPLLTVREVADYLGLAEQTIRNRVNTDAGFPRLKVGRSLRFRRRDLDEWIRAQTEESRAPASDRSAA